MKFDDLSQEAKEVAIGMIEYCIENNLRMGMDEGIQTWTKNDKPKKKHPFRLEIERFVRKNS